MKPAPKADGRMQWRHLALTGLMLAAACTLPLIIFMALTTSLYLGSAVLLIAVPGLVVFAILDVVFSWLIIRRRYPDRRKEALLLAATTVILAKYLSRLIPLGFTTYLAWFSLPVDNFHLQQAPVSVLVSAVFFIISLAAAITAYDMLQKRYSRQAAVKILWIIVTMIFGFLLIKLLNYI